ncbi:MAG: hypothetical protein CMH75_05610 [Nitrospina sp.]|nr:hypothetical protein [Nitrospina sp.]|tara:strand:- start:4444 stop:6318 length:1875 start_codon:yes stop_codon:yes gene_type:complete
MTENLIFLNHVNLSKKEIYELSNTGVIYSMNFEVHQYLEKLSIKHEIAENVLDANDECVIFDKVVNLYDWYKKIPKHEEMEFHGFNLFEMMDTTELHTFLINKLYDIYIIQKILSIKKPKKIFSTLSQNFISGIIDDKTKFFPIGNGLKTDMVWNKIEIKFNLGKIPISLKLSRNIYLKLKSIFENFICSSNNLWVDLNTPRDTILLLEFNPSTYSELIKNFSMTNKQVVLFNNRRSAIWNKSSISLLKSTNSKILSINKLLTSSQKQNIEKERLQYEKILKNLLEEKSLYDIFILNGQSFWNEIKSELINTFLNRLLWYMQLIYSSKLYIQNSKIHSILSLNVIGETEKSILSQKLENTNSIMLEHAFANYTEEISRYDILSNYSLFPDKIAVWGDVQKKYLKTIHNISDKRIIVCGSPRHDSFFKTKEPSKTLKNTILICPRPIIELACHNDTTMYIKYETILKTVIQKLQQLPNTELIVKLHPGDISHNNLIQKVVSEIDTEILIYHSKPIEQLIKKSDLVFVISPEGYDPSTVILESIIFEKPTVNLVLDDKFYDFSYELHNAVISITKNDNPTEIIQKIFHDEEFRSNLISNGKNFLREYISNPETASKSLVKQILKLN